MLKEQIIRSKRYTTILCCFLACYCYAGPAVPPATDTVIIPAPLQQRLQQFRQDDDLSGWLYERMAYVADDPASRISLLMQCEKDAWRTIRTDGDYLAWQDLLVNQGYYQLYLGNILLSIQCYEQAWAFYKKVQPDPYDVEEHILKPLGNNYTRLGDYESAFYIQQQLLTLTLRNKEPLAIAAAYANMAVLRRSQGEWQLAATLCRQGLPYAGIKTPVRGLLLNTLADLATAQGQYDSARLWNREAIRLLLNALPAPGVAYWLESAYVQAGQLSAATGAYTAAINYYTQAQQVTDHYFKGGRQREQANVCILTGHVLLERNNMAAAAQQYLRALKILLPDFSKAPKGQLPQEAWLYGEYMLQDALAGLARVYYKQGQATQALATIDLCFAAAAKLRNELAGMDSRRLQQQENRRRIELAMEISHALWSSTGNVQYANRMLQYAEQGKAQWLLDEIRRNIAYVALRDKDTLFRRMQKVEQAIAYYGREAAGATLPTGKSNTRSALEYEMSALQKALQQRYPALLQSSNLTAIQNNTLLQQLPENTSLLACFAGEKKWFLLYADRNGVYAVHTIDSAPAVKAQCLDFVQRYFQHGAGAMINAPQEYYKAAYDLYATLLGKQEWHPGRQYLFLTDDVLGYLPFDALVTDSTYRQDISSWPYLVKKANISYAYSLQSWQQLRRRKPAGNGFTGFFITHDSSSAIPAVVAEQQQIKQIVKGNFLENNAATLQHFDAALQQAGVLHISTHAGLYGALHEPMLELANGRFALSALTARQYAPQLVVLSACRTADGWLMQGEGVLSLSWGFAAAGIPGVVAGLWNVNDAGAASFMPHFYSNLQQRQDVAAALHEAKVEWLLEQRNPVLQLPWYWAGWIYMGVPQTVTVTAPVASSWYWIPVAVLLIAAVLLLWRKNRRVRIFSLFYRYKK